MREIKFRAIIKEKNATIYFSLQDLLEDRFSIREILIPWLKKGNQPDEFTGRKDKNGIEIYEGDIVKDGNLELAVTFEHHAWMLDKTVLLIILK